MIQYLQITDNGKQPPHRLKCMQSLRENFGDNKYNVIEFPYSEYRCKNVACADEIRLRLAAENEDLCYVDTDCFISVPLHETSFNNGIPLFGMRDVGDDTYPDIFYFYVNGKCDYFKNNLSTTLLSNTKYSIPLETLKGLKGFEYISNMSYYHQYTTLNEVVSAEK